MHKAEKIKRLQELQDEQKVLARKAIRIIKYYPKAKRESTTWNRIIRVIVIVSRIASIQAHKNVIIAQRFPKGGEVFKVNRNLK